MLLLFIIISMVNTVHSVSPMMSMVRRVQYSSAAPSLPCSICQEAVYLTWGQSPASSKEFVVHSKNACSMATRRDHSKESLCQSVLSAHSEKLFRGNLHRGKEDCLLTGATDCEVVSKWTVHCDQQKKPCHALPVS